MKNILVAMLLVANIAHAQTYIAKAVAGADQASVIQAAFNKQDIRTVLVNTSGIVINGTVTIPQGKTLKIEHGFKVSGNGTINGGNIEADYQAQIFDTALTINPKSVNEYFSVKWFGATGNNTDDHTAIQKAINEQILTQKQEPLLKKHFKLKIHVE